MNNRTYGFYPWPYPQLPSEFSNATVDLRQAEAVVTYLADALTEYEHWVEQYGYESRVTVEAMLTAVEDAMMVLQSWVDEHRDWLKAATTAQTGIARMLEVLADVSQRIHDTFPCSPEAQDNSMLRRLAPGAKVFRFDKHLVPQLRFVAESFTEWQGKAAIDGSVELSADREEGGHVRTLRGSANDLIMAALRVHHRYDDTGVLKTDPIGQTELAAKKGMPVKSTISKWFTSKWDGGYNGYVAACTNGTLAAWLKVMSGDATPKSLANRAGVDPDDLSAD